MSKAPAAGGGESCVYEHIYAPKCISRRVAIASSCASYNTADLSEVAQEALLTLRLQQALLTLQEALLTFI